MTIKYKQTISTLLVLLIAVVTGVSVGKIYVDSLEVAPIVAASEEALRANDDVEALVARAKFSSVTSFTPVELYLIAEHNLNNSPEFYKIMTGTVYATLGITQPMKGERLKTNGKLIYNKLSPSTSSFAPAICSRVIYDYATPDEVTVIPTGTFASTSPDLIGNFNSADADVYTLDEYRETFNTFPTTVLPYIITSITCADADNISEVTDNGDDTYSFSISLSGSSLAMAGLYYAYEIRFSSGMSDLPSWTSMTMEVTIDSSFNFVEISYNETYRMNAPAIGMTPVTDEFVDRFYFDEETIQQAYEAIGEVQ